MIKDRKRTNALTGEEIAKLKNAIEEGDNNLNSEKKINSLAGKEIYLTEGFELSGHLIWQVIGNYGGFVQDRELEGETNLIVFSSSLLEKMEYRKDSEYLINLRNACLSSKLLIPQKDMISERGLLQYLGWRSQNDRQTAELYDKFIKALSDVR